MGADLLTTPRVLVFMLFMAESVNALCVKGVVFLRLLIFYRPTIFDGIFLHFK